VANLFYIKTEYASATILATQENKASHKLTIYPNPVENSFSISSTDAVEWITIINNGGEILKTIRRKCKKCRYPRT
jgi:hypothetical protein